VKLNIAPCTPVSYTRPYLTLGDSKIHLFDLLPCSKRTRWNIVGALMRNGGHAFRFGDDLHDAAIAVHEAGHFVMLEICRYQSSAVCHWVSLKEGDDHLGGIFVSSFEVASPLQGMDSMLVSCGGYAALRALGVPRKAALEGTEQDFAQAEAVRQTWKLRPVADYMKLAVEALSSEAHRRAICAVAEALIEHREIDGVKAREIVREVAL
jgi:hypothetical protein